MTRPSWDEYFMNIAHEVACRSTCTRAPVGAVIVKDKRILTTGYNGSPRGLAHCMEVGCLMDNEHCVRTLHAEQNAIIQAALHGVSTRGADIYVTHQPCFICAKMIINAEPTQNRIRPHTLPAINFSFLDYKLIGNQLDLLKWHPPESQRFLVTQFIFEHECPDILDELITDKVLTSDDARARARRAMARYAAGAFLFPYKPFLKAAIELRYDIQALQQRFSGSFEQIIHRLMTLRAPGSAGIPFLFLRTDLAGNISKRFSLSNLHLPRYGGACPLWALYRAFLTPGQIIAQKVRMPTGQEFLFIARTITKQADSFGAPEKTYSLMLGCDLAYADQIIYGEAYEKSQASLITEAGSSCRLCPRQACVHRAHAPILATAT